MKTTMSVRKRSLSYCIAHLYDHTVMLDTHKAAYVAETPASVKDSKKAATASKLEVRDIEAVNRQSIKRSQKKGGKKDVFTTPVLTNILLCVGSVIHTTM